MFNSSGISYYRHADWLGSSRLALYTTGAVYADQAYAPFGETYSETGTADRSFTGQTQDTTAGSQGVYDFLLRQQSAAHGRWLAPDPAGMAAVDITNPQTWNRYAYVGNNPLSLVDPYGLDPNVPGSFSFPYKPNQQGDLSCSIDGMMGVPCGLVGSFETADRIDLCNDGFCNVHYGRGANGQSQQLNGWKNVKTTDATGEPTTIQQPVWYSTPDPVLLAQNGATASKTPFSVSMYLPAANGVGGYTYTYTHIAADGQPTYNCRSHSATISTPAAKATVSGGPLTLFGQSTEKAQSVISSWGWNFSLQPLPWLGYQVNVNSSGVVGGFTFGIPGASASYGWGSCTKAD